MRKGPGEKAKGRRITQVYKHQRSSEVVRTSKTQKQEGRQGRVSYRTASALALRPAGADRVRTLGAATEEALCSSAAMLLKESGEGVVWVFECLFAALWLVGLVGWKCFPLSFGTLQRFGKYMRILPRCLVWPSSLSSKKLMGGGGMGSGWGGLFCVPYYDLSMQSCICRVPREQNFHKCAFPVEESRG